ncbi:MAG: 4Fe-4S dicluster domain-containing protein [Bacillota bacterium]
MRSRLRKVKTVIRRNRRVSQVAVLALLVLSPFLHIFRFDIPTTSLYLFGMRLWVQHAFVFSLLMTLIIYVIIAASFVFGRVFCGWVCPQNLFNELGRQWDARFGRAGTVALSFLISLFGGFVIWSYGADGIGLLRRYAAGELPIAPTLAILSFALFFTMAMAWWRTSICKVACPYGHLQSIISNRETMHLKVINLPQNRDICASCGLCAEICHMDVDPRSDEQKHCVACGDCLDACALVSDARKVPRVLNFVVGQGENEVALRERSQLWANIRRVAPRLALPLAMTLALGIVSGYLLSSRTLVDLVVVKDHRQVLATGGTVSGGSVMNISLMNLAATPDQFRLYIEGLPDGWASLEHEAVALAPGERAQVTLRVNPTERVKGLHSFHVRVVGIQTGAEASFRTVHAVN